MKDRIVQLQELAKVLEPSADDRYLLRDKVIEYAEVFRYVPRRGDPNSFNRKLMISIQQDGRIFLSSTTINGEFALRLAILSFRTHLDTIDLVLDILEKKARDLERNSQ